MTKFQGVTQPHIFWDEVGKIKADINLAEHTWVWGVPPLLMIKDKRKDE